jgi:hypothetical protein
MTGMVDISASYSANDAESMPTMPLCIQGQDKGPVYLLAEMRDCQVKGGYQCQI